jgi:hypothetical protein
MEEHRQNRQRRIEAIRESLRRKESNSTLGVPSRDGFASANGGMIKRSTSPYVDFGGQGFENPRALFVRPGEIIFVNGAE